MARYLTPSKIALLALTAVYTDSAVPAAAVISILSFLVSCLSPVPPQSVELLNASLRNAVVDIELLQQTTISHPSGIPGRTVWDLVLKKLWALDCLDALHAFFEQLSLVVKKNTGDDGSHAPGDRPRNKQILLSRTSPLGLFVRRAQLEFSRLQFHDTVILWQSFVAYRSPTAPQWRRRNPSANVSLDVNLDGHGTSNSPLSLALDTGRGEGKVLKSEEYSIDDVEKLLETQVNQMQKMGTPLPQAVTNQLRLLLTDGASIPNLCYYAQFLDAWKLGDYIGSFDSLHRYFDYTMHNRDQLYYQYASLNLAVLHADFGAYAEAIAAMNEATSVAREHLDVACLNYSLSWLYHFGKAHPRYMHKIQQNGVLGTEKEALNFLKAKAKETAMWSVLSTALLSEAKLYLSTGESVSYAFESTLRASHISLEKRVSNVVGSQMSMQSTLFNRLGVNAQSWLTEQIFIACYQAQSSTEDVLHCMCRSARLLSQRGRHVEALALLEQIDQDTLRTLKYRQYWSAQRGLLKMRRFLYREDLSAAEHVLAQLATMKDLSHDVAYDITLQQINLLIRKRDYAKAMTIVETLADLLDQEGADIHQRAKVMITKARIHQRAGTAQKGFSLAVRAATVAHCAHLLPILWEAIGCICGVLHSLDEFQGSLQMLENVMPQLLESGDCDLAAHSYLLIADAQVGLAGSITQGALQRKEKLTRGLESLDMAFGEFAKLQDIGGQCEVLAKKASILQFNGDRVLANDCASQYLSIKRSSLEEV